MAVQPMKCSKILTVLMVAGPVAILLKVPMDLFTELPVMALWPMEVHCIKYILTAPVLL